MTVAIFVGVMCVIMNLIFVPYIENACWNSIATFGLMIGYAICLAIAYAKEYQLKSRIEALEDDKEE